MKVLVGLTALFMLSSLGVGMMLSHGPQIRSVSWSDGTVHSQDGWGPDTRITNAPSGSNQPAAVRDGEGDLHVVWTDYRAGEPDIYYKKVGPRGEQLIADQRLSSSLSQSVFPAVAVDGQNQVHVAWLDDRGGVWNVYYARLDGNGKVLVSDLQITNIHPLSLDSARSPQPPPIQRLDHITTLLDIQGRRPSIDVDAAGNAHLAWADFRDGEGDIRYTVVGAQGSILADQVKVSTTAADSYNAVVRAVEGEFVLVWAERSGETAQIYYSRMDDSGNYLVIPRVVLSEPGQMDSLDAAVDTAGGVRVAWSSDRNLNFDIYYAALTPAGELLAPEAKLTSMLLDSTDPVIEVDTTGAVHIAWSTAPDRLGRLELGGVFYARLTERGDMIDPPITMTGAGDRAQSPALMLSADDLPTLVWSDSRNGPPNTELYLKTKVTIEAGTSGETTAVTVSSGQNYVPAAVAVGGLGAVVAVALTEAGRYKLTLLAIPLYSRLKKESLLNHSVREQIFGYVNSHPGANFSQIMKELNLKNGVLAYHLTTLEREDLIKSLRDGTYRRYYPRSSRSVPFEIQRSIIEKIEQNPGIAEGELANRLGISRQVLDYHLNSLIDSGHVRLERRGKRNLAYVTQVAA